MLLTCISIKYYYSYIDIHKQLDDGNHDQYMIERGKSIAYVHIYMFTDENVLDDVRRKRTEDEDDVNGGVLKKPILRCVFE